MLSFLLSSALIARVAPIERRVLAMGTHFSVQVGAGSGGAEAAVQEVARIEAACSTWRPDSAWSHLNRAGGQAVPLAPEWLRLLARVQTWSRATSGTFDPALMALLQAWGTREGGRIPNPQELTAARAASGSALLHLDDQAGTAWLSHPNAGLEEGGFLKGYALDAARSEAERRGASSGLLDFGGQLLAWGKPVDVEIAHPRRRQQAALRVALEQASLSTSGCSERGRHILDPRTGQPCPDWGAVSVIASTGLDADVLSTALFVMGPQEGLAWAEAHQLAAVFLSHDGAIRMTTAFHAFNPTFFQKEMP